jgi:uncharacterized membrane protein (UPF0127 family)
LTAREPTQQRIPSGAVLWAAPLFAVAALLVVLTGPVCARMRVDKLWLVIGAGQETPIDVEMAETPKEKELGLMFRTELADNQGMLFPYGAPQEVTMWMHNTYIPLDMVFIRADGTVHRIEQRAEPLSDRIISSEGQVSAVLEMAGGAAQRLGLKPGDRIRHPLFGAR